MEIKPIARIRSDFHTKFGIPRQSGLARTTAEIIFEPEYRVTEAVRGLEGFSRIWMIWEFSENTGKVKKNWSPTVRPPRLGGNTRVGVFATRSPFRPNSLGLSCVKLNSVEIRKDLGPVLTVTGADLMDGTPIYDIKPYIPSSDSFPDAQGGFTDSHPFSHLKVVFPENLLQKISEEKRAGLLDVLAEDPRPSYQKDPNRVYGIFFNRADIRFRVEGRILTVLEVNTEVKTDV